MIDLQGLVIAPCIATFGQPATLMQGGVNIVIAPPLNGVFDEAYAETDVSDSMPVTTLSPCFGFNLADVNLSGAPVSSLQGARLTVLAAPTGSPPVDTAYIVREARADGHGWARLMLNLAPIPADEPTGVAQDS